MAGNFKGFLVVLDIDVNDEGAHRLAEAIRCLDGVIKVTDIPKDHVGDISVRLQVQNEYRKKLWKALED